MRYTKQFHNWPSIYLLPLLFGGACLGMIFVWENPSEKPKRSKRVKSKRSKSEKGRTTLTYQFDWKRLYEEAPF